MKGISRIDSPKCHGWLARVYRNQQEHPKLFSDLKYGGKLKALALAKAYLKTMEKALPPSTKETPPPFILSGKRINTNRTGVNGVSLLTERRGRKKVWIGYAVSGKIGNRPTNKRFLFSTIGSKRDTLKAAVNFRKKLERIMLRDWKALMAKKNKLAKKKKTVTRVRKTRTVKNKARR